MKASSSLSLNMSVQLYVPVASFSALTNLVLRRDRGYARAIYLSNELPSRYLNIIRKRAVLLTRQKYNCTSIVLYPEEGNIAETSVSNYLSASIL